MIPLLVIGINHESASVDVRERVNFAPELMVSALQALLSQTTAQEAAILSTCNRTELYVLPEDESSHNSGQHFIEWLGKHHQVTIAELNDACYIHKAEQALNHMMTVASGLDSMVLGEPQILGQMKSSFAVAQEAGALGSELHTVFQRVFSSAKRVRTETAIGRNPVSVAFAAVDLAKRIFSDLKQDTALLIGAGETIDLVARHLKESGIANIIFANRTLERAQRLADEFDAHAVLLSDIPEVLVKADIVISSTASQLPVLGKGAVESALKQRKHKPIFMVDIAVPRDIEPEVAELDDVYLYTVDDLKEVIDENKQSRAIAAEEAHMIVQDSVQAFLRETRARESIAVIKSYRHYAEELRDAALSKALKDLANGVSPDKVVQQMANSLTNKLLHTPTQQLKQAGEEGQYELLELSQKILGFPAKKK